MRALVTGAAGFIGSTLVERLLDEHHAVVGVDCFTDYYDPAVKRDNLATAARSDAFVLHEVDLRTGDLDGLLDSVDVVFHQAGQPGVRLSWDEGFEMYDTCNVLATQRLLEACRRTGKPAGTAVSSREDLARRLEQGFTFFDYASDLRLLQAQVKAANAPL